MRFFFITLCVSIIVALPLLSQENAQYVCSACKQPINAESKFCTSCGARLTEQAIEPQETKSFTFRQPSRLFSVPTAAVIPELSIGLTLGNSFGQQERRAFLGNVSIGIGEIAELELNTGGMVGNVVAGTSRMSTWAMKVRFTSGDEYWPAAAVSLRSSNDWDEANFDAVALEASSPDFYRSGLRGLDYEMRMTTAALSLSWKTHEKTTVHGTIGIADIRNRNLGVQRKDSIYFFDTSVRRSSQWLVSGGFATIVKSRTCILVEAQTIPFFNYNVTSGSLKLEHMYVGAVGIRFALGKAITLDSGVRYQSDFIGLADVQIRVALNGVFLIPM